MYQIRNKTLCFYSDFNSPLNPYLYYLIGFCISYGHKHKNIMFNRCKVNMHNKYIRKSKLIHLLIKN